MRFGERIGSSRVRQVRCVQKPQPLLTRRQLCAVDAAYPDIAVRHGVIVGVPIDQGLASLDNLLLALRSQRRHMHPALWCAPRRPSRCSHASYGDRRATDRRSSGRHFRKWRPNRSDPAFDRSVRAAGSRATTRPQAGVVECKDDAEATVTNPMGTNARGSPPGPRSR